MTSKAYQKCEAIIHAAVERGFTDNISRLALEDIIMELVGGDMRTLAKYVGLLERLGFVAGNGRDLFHLRLVKVEGCLERAVSLGQKRLL